MECGTLGRPSSDNGRIRVYTKAECDQLKGDYMPQSGECLSKTGGSFSFDCKYLNDQQPTTTPTATPNNKMSTEMIGIIVGGVIGGLLLIGIVTLIYSNYSTKQGGGGRPKMSVLKWILLAIALYFAISYFKNRSV